MARPASAQAKIDKEELEKLLGLQPNEKEAADWFDVSINSLVRFIKTHYDCSFEELRDKRFVRTRMSIKRAQIQEALKGNATLLIWTGKQYLGQTDKQEVATSNINLDVDASNTELARKLLEAARIAKEL